MPFTISKEFFNSTLNTLLLVSSSAIAATPTMGMADSLDNDRAFQFDANIVQIAGVPQATLDTIAGIENRMIVNSGATEEGPVYTLSENDEIRTYMTPSTGENGGSLGYVVVIDGDTDRGFILAQGALPHSEIDGPVAEASFPYSISDSYQLSKPNGFCGPVADATLVSDEDLASQGVEKLGEIELGDGNLEISFLQAPDGTGFATVIDSDTFCFIGNVIYDQLGENLSPLNER